MRWRTAGALTAALALGTIAPALPDRSIVPGYVGGFRWIQADANAGGYSGIEVSEDGSSFTALTDRGGLSQGRLSRDERGVISAVEAGPPQLLAQPSGEVPEGYRFDTEGLAMAEDGSLYVSAEFVARILRYARPDAAPEVLPIPPAFGLMELNGGPEPLAINAQGVLFTLPEVTTRPDGNYPVYRFRDGVWDQPFVVRGLSSFLPTAADFGPDGRLYLLERQFLGIAGFASRVRRIEIAESGIARDETLLQTAPGAFGNMEGLAVWQDAEGALRLTLISDDNFLSVLGTEIVEFRVPD
ncbi:MAG: hypothetical protein DI533_12305 [Cereibacter sphaeroides]|uniref:Phytase-like domain-containing protein n=1 Tax=Cereibacter sphaeroides TaxID=1063 RepID=A0A2W5TQ44_CERSP|nr:MAG: hypothetical protein DI533_12305 [Cereibacter sphaeroides]